MLRAGFEHTIPMFDQALPRAAIVYTRI